MERKSDSGMKVCFESGEEANHIPDCNLDQKDKEGSRNYKYKLTGRYENLILIGWSHCVQDGVNTVA